MRIAYELDEEPGQSPAEIEANEVEAERELARELREERELIEELVAQAREFLEAKVYAIARLQAKAALEIASELGDEELGGEIEQLVAEINRQWSEALGQEVARLTGSQAPDACAREAPTSEQEVAACT